MFGNAAKSSLRTVAASSLRAGRRSFAASPIARGVQEITRPAIDTPLSLWNFTEEENMLRESVRRFAEDVIAPKSRDMDEREVMDDDIVKGLFENGLMGIETPQELDGAGCSFTSAIIAVEELAKVDASVAVLCDVHNTLVNTVLRLYGSEAIQQKWLPGLATNTVGSFCLSEPNAGSDAFSLQTTAKKDSDGGYILNGSKCWISNSAEADTFLVFANVDPSKGYKGITCFVMSKDMGVEIAKKEKKLGIRSSSTCVLSFDDVKVPKENIVGEIGKGYKIAIEILNEGRIGIAAQMVGVAQGAFDHAVGYSYQRKQFGKYIGDFQKMGHDFADAAVKIEAARLLTYNAARLKEEGRPFTMEAAMAKYYASVIAQEVSGAAIEWAGGVGFTRDLPLEKFWRDSKIGAIYEGTSNIQLETIAKLLRKQGSKMTPKRRNRPSASSPGSSTSRSSAAAMTSRGVQFAENEDDDPLAMTPIKATRTQRVQSRSRSSTKSKRPKFVSRTSRTGADRVVGGVEMDEEDLVPPSEDEEFDTWASKRMEAAASSSRGSTAELRSVSRPVTMPHMASSPLHPSRGNGRLLATHEVVSPARMLVGQSSSTATTATTATASTLPIPFNFFSDQGSSDSEMEDETPLDARADQEGILVQISGPQTAEREASRTDQQTRMPGVSRLEEDGRGSGHDDESRADILPLEEPISEIGELGPVTYAKRPSQSAELIIDARETATAADFSAAITSTERSPIIALPVATAKTAATVDEPSSLILSKPHDTSPRAARSEIENAPRPSPTTVHMLDIEQPLMLRHHATVFPLTPKRPTGHSSASPITPLLRSHSQASRFSPPAASFDSTAHYNQLALYPEEAPDASEVSRSERSASGNAEADEGGQHDMANRDRLDPPADVPMLSEELNASETIPLPDEIPVPPAPVDPALQRYRSARTFRTRTALQLQPYTRERIVYEAALRRGGLRTNKDAVALPKEISTPQSRDTPPAESASSSSSSSSSRIVIGNSPKASPQRRKYRRLDILDDDLRDFYIEYGEEANLQDSNHEDKLQRIARKRVRTERQERREEREARAAEKRFNELIKGDTIRDEPAIALRRFKAKQKQRTEGQPKQPRPSAPRTWRESSSVSSYAVDDYLADPPTRSTDPEVVVFRDSASPPAAEPYDPGGPDDDDDGIPRQASSSSASDVSVVDDLVRDRRARIAGRMLPAAMLKRLEKEAEAKTRAKTQTRTVRVESPPHGPGKAIRRHGGPAGNIDGLFDGPDSDESDAGARSDPSVVYVRSSSSESGSQAEEDNRNGETLARLYDGDFESIVHGPRISMRQAAPRQRHRAHEGRRHDGGKPSAMRQTKLNSHGFRSHGRRSDSIPHKAKRARVRLDDRALFRRPQAPKGRRSVIPPASGPTGNEIDSGVGQARSWANLARLSTDFDIAPLPSGLELRAFPFLGLDGCDVEERITALGVTLDARQDDESLSTAIALYFQQLGHGMRKVERSEMHDAMRFILQTLYSRNIWIDGGLSELSTTLTRVISSLRLSDEKIPVELLELHAYVLAMRMAAYDNHVHEVTKSQALAAAEAFLHDLFLEGIDRAIKPLKTVLRGESVTHRITDQYTSFWAWTLTQRKSLGGDAVDGTVFKALEAAFSHDMAGPIASERIWYTIFAMSALTQFNAEGRTDDRYIPQPRWGLVRKALGMIRLSHDEEAEEKAQRDLLRGRDRYIRIMITRCLRLSSLWKWSLDTESFSVVTKDLGMIFKQRQYRNFPTEPPVDFPVWITSLNISKTATQESSQETAFELYLRLVCIGACDIIDAASDIAEAERAEKHIQRLIMSIIPVSAVKFNRLLPPNARQLGQLVNRYAAIIAAAYFSPNIIPWLLSTSRHWTAFETADLDSRQISIRGLMYLGIACRHHHQSVTPVVGYLAAALDTLQKALDGSKDQQSAQVPSRMETHRTMVLVISCFKQIILHNTLDPMSRGPSIYPDLSLLDPSWTMRIFELSATDPRSGEEVISALQAFLDCRERALPRGIRQARQSRLESQDEYGSLGFELDPITVAQLGGEGVEAVDEDAARDKTFAELVADIIAPRLYTLLSDLLPAVHEKLIANEGFIARITKCWFDCATVLVIDHRRLDWTTFIGAYGQQSWGRLASDNGRVQVGMIFMLSMAKVDATAFAKHSEIYISLLFDAVGADNASLPAEYVAGLLQASGSADHPLLEGLQGVRVYETFLGSRQTLLEILFRNLRRAFENTAISSIKKPFLYRCVNDFVSGVLRREKSIPEENVLHKTSYHELAMGMIRTLRSSLGNHVNEAMVPSLKAF